MLKNKKNIKLIAIVAALGVFYIIGNINKAEKTPTVTDPIVKENDEKKKDNLEETIDKDLSVKETIEKSINENFDSNEKLIELSFEESTEVSPVKIVAQGSSMFFETTYYSIAEATIRHLSDDIKNKISEYEFEIHSELINKNNEKSIEKVMTFKIDAKKANNINWVHYYPEKLYPDLKEVWMHNAVM